MKMKNKDNQKNILISEYIDSNAMNILEIMDNFSQYLKEYDGSRLTIEQRKEVINLLEQNRILRILCSAMYSQGYNSF